MPAPRSSPGGVRLHGSEGSSSTRRVEIALAVKDIPYETERLDLDADGGEHQRGAYRKLNPMAEVPTLEIDGHVLSQTMAILEYLDETRPDPPLLPEAPAARARVRQVAEVVNASIQPLQNRRVLLQLREQFGADEQAAKRWAGFWIARGLTGLEALVRESAGTYCVGSSITLADVLLYPQLLNARALALKLSLFPTLQGIGVRLDAVPAFRATNSQTR